MKPKHFQDFLTLRGTLLLVAFWGLINSAVRLIPGTTLAMDDGKENIFTQSLEWAYLPDNPPLFEWLLITVQQVTGPTLFSFLIVKYALLVLTSLFLFLVARRVFTAGHAGAEGGYAEANRWAAVTVLSAVTLYQLGYNYHQAFTHSLVVIASVCFGLWAFLRLLQEQRSQDYVLMGLAIGLGLLSKYNFAGFLAVMLIPAVMDRRYRGVILNWRFALSLAIGAAIVLPHLLAVIDRAALFQTYVAGKLGVDSGSHLSRTGEGLGNAITAIISFFLPFLLLAAIIWGRSLMQKPGAEPGPARLLRRSALVASGLILAGVLLLGVSNVTERYVIPFFLPAFVYAIWHLQQVNAANARLGRWLTGVAIMAVAIIAIRLTIFLVAAPPFCDPCTRWVPYATLAQAIEEKALQTDGIFISYEEDTAGNLRKAFPKAAVRSLNLMFYQPVRWDTDRPCYFVWSEDLVGAKLIPPFDAYADVPETFMVDARWSHPFKDEWTTTRWGVTPVETGGEFYQRFCAVNARG